MLPEHYFEYPFLSTFWTIKIFCNKIKDGVLRRSLSISEILEKFQSHFGTHKNNFSKTRANALIQCKYFQAFFSLLINF